ncbi:hypothetical protein BD626DRAFT_574957 [Schizophyllum amplum]|uniref:TERF2-interacting telomeric protein 1 Myb domain-containing protein n=1 Tax=Schizophyllum amplum TaxID=97359 RepID=A0A550BWS6_9AGAR|nr:hypothetical protein BD626DRAFT_574957 [Auriculariopsis ampla]
MVARQAYTVREDKHIIEFLALHNEDGVGRSGNKIWKDLLVADEVRFPWAKTHTWQSWRDHYKKNEDVFDRKVTKFIKRLRLAGAEMQVNRGGNANGRVNAGDAGSAIGEKDAADEEPLPATPKKKRRRRAVVEDSDEEDAEETPPQPRKRRKMRDEAERPSSVRITRKRRASRANTGTGASIHPHPGSQRHVVRPRVPASTARYYAVTPPRQQTRLPTRKEEPRVSRVQKQPRASSSKVRVEDMRSDSEAEEDGTEVQAPGEEDYDAEIFEEEEMWTTAMAETRRRLCMDKEPTWEKLRRKTRTAATVITSPKKTAKRRTARLQNVSSTHAHSRNTIARRTCLSRPARPAQSDATSTTRTTLPPAQSPPVAPAPSTALPSAPSATLIPALRLPPSPPKRVKKPSKTIFDDLPSSHAATPASNRGSPASDHDSSATQSPPPRPPPTLKEGTFGSTRFVQGGARVVQEGQEGKKWPPVRRKRRRSDSSEDEGRVRPGQGVGGRGEVAAAGAASMVATTNATGAAVKSGPPPVRGSLPAANRGRPSLQDDVSRKASVYLPPKSSVPLPTKDNVSLPSKSSVPLPAKRPKDTSIAAPSMSRMTSTSSTGRHAFDDRGRIRRASDVGPVNHERNAEPAHRGEPSGPGLFRPTLPHRQSGLSIVRTASFQSPIVPAKMVDTTNDVQGSRASSGAIGAPTRGAASRRHTIAAGTAGPLLDLRRLVARAGTGSVSGTSMRSFGHSRASSLATHTTSAAPSEASAQSTSAAVQRAPSPAADPPSFLADVDTSRDRAMLEDLGAELAVRRLSEVWGFTEREVAPIFEQTGRSLSITERILRVMREGAKRAALELQGFMIFLRWIAEGGGRQSEPTAMELSQSFAPQDASTPPGQARSPSRSRRRSLQLRISPPRPSRRDEERYSPPAHTRGATFARLEREGRTAEARARERRRASGGLPPPNLASTPRGVPVKEEPVERLWTEADERLLRSANEENIGDLRALGARTDIGFLLGRVQVFAGEMCARRRGANAQAA